jgi:hypothetical protein
MTEAPVDIIAAFLDFYDEHERLARNVVGRLVEAGFTYRLLTRTTVPVDVQALMWDDFARNRKAIAKASRAHAVDKGGWIEIRFDDRTFLRAYYRADGMVRYHFGGGAESALETLARERDLFLSVRERMMRAFDETFLSQAATLVCRFFRGVPPSGYRLEGFVGGERVTAGEWRGDHLAIEVVKIKPFFDFALTLFQGADVRRAAMRSPGDLARFYDGIRLGLDALAGTLTAEGYRLEVTADGAPLFRTGKRVKAYPTTAYGNTEIRADNTLAAIARAMR